MPHPPELHRASPPRPGPQPRASRPARKPEHGHAHRRDGPRPRRFRPSVRLVACMQMGGGNALIDPSSTEARAEPGEAARSDPHPDSSRLVRRRPADRHRARDGLGRWRRERRVRRPRGRPDQGQVVEVNPTLAASTQPNSSNGISTPWKPASRPGGGAAMAPRGGSGGRRQPVASSAMVGPPPRSAPPGRRRLARHDPRAYRRVRRLGRRRPGPGPTVTRNTAARVSSGRRPDRPPRAHRRLATTAPAATVPTTIAENPSSLPSSSVAGGSGSPSSRSPVLPALRDPWRVFGVVLCPAMSTSRLR